MGGGRREKWGHIHIHFLSCLIYISLKTSKKPYFHGKEGTMTNTWNLENMNAMKRGCSWRERTGQGYAQGAGHRMLQSFVSQSCAGFQSPSWSMEVAPISPPQIFWSCLESVFITVSPLTSHEVPEKPDLTCFPAALLPCICVWDRGHQAGVQGCFTWVVNMETAKGRNRLLIMGSSIDSLLNFGVLWERWFISLIVSGDLLNAEHVYKSVFLDST